jgi:peroxiredoxin
MRGTRFLPLAVAALLVAAAPGTVSALKDLEVGQQIPAFSLATPGGDPYGSDYFDGTGGVILFWSTWSPRSAEILEDFKAHHEAYAEEGLRILAVNIDGEKLSQEEQRAVVRFAESRDLPFPVLLDEKLETFVSYGVMAHPSSVVVSPEGRITYLLGGYPLSLRAELTDEIRKVLGIYVEPPPEVDTSDVFFPDGGARQHYKMGLTLLERDQPERALRAFDMARERDSDFLEPVVMSARVHLADRNFQAAEELLQSADMGLVNRNDLRYILGLILLSKEKDAMAEKQFLALRQKSPGENWGYWGLAMVHLSRAEYAEALEQLKAAPEKEHRSIELESHVREHFTGLWRQGRSGESETEFLALFPGLRDTRKRYEIMFSLPGGE